jgi:hypothetical protein
MWVNYLIQEASLCIHAYGVHVVLAKSCISHVLFNIILVPTHDDLINQVINLQYSNENLNRKYNNQAFMSQHDDLMIF